MRLDQDALKSIKLPAGVADQIFWDDKISGFGVRVRAQGGRSWVFQYRVRGESKARRFTIGNAENMRAAVARERAKDMHANVHNGADPQAQKLEDRKLARVTFGGILPEYLEHKAGEVRPRTLIETRRYLMKHCAPLHRERLDKIGRADLADVLAKIGKAKQVPGKKRREGGPVAKVRAYAALSDFFGWAVGTKCVIDVNPLATMTKPAGSKGRDRVLKPHELADVWRGCEDDDFGRIVRLLILTLQRRNEVGEMERRELDLDGATWTIAAERAKNHRKHVVPLSPLAVKLIEAAPVREGEPGKAREAVFGQGAGGFSGWSKAKLALDARITEARKGEALEPWTLHDLRRTGDTLMNEELGIAPHVVDAILNHVSGKTSGKAGVSGTYNHATYLAERKAAHLRWEDYILALASGGARKVIPMRRA